MPPRNRLHLVAASILLAGLGGAVYIYLTVEDVTENAMVQEFQNSKRYHHELEAYGGKVNVLASDLTRWFDGLWHGQNLAFTVAALSVVAALFILAIGKLLAIGPADDRDETNHRT